MHFSQFLEYEELNEIKENFNFSTWLIQLLEANIHHAEKVKQSISDQDMESAAEEVAMEYEKYATIVIAIDRAARKHAQENSLPSDWTATEGPPAEIVAAVNPRSIVDEVLSMSSRFTGKPFDPSYFLTSKAKGDDKASLNRKVTAARNDMAKGKGRKRTLTKMFAPALKKVGSTISRMDPEFNLEKDTGREGSFYRTFQNHFNNWKKEIDKWIKSNGESEGDNEPAYANFPSIKFIPPGKYHNNRLTPEDEALIRDVKKFLEEDPDNMQTYVVDTAKIASNAAKKQLARDGYSIQSLSDLGFNQDDLVQIATMGIMKDINGKKAIDFFNDTHRIGWGMLAIKQAVLNAAGRKDKTISGDGDIENIGPIGKRARPDDMQRDAMKQQLQNLPLHVLADKDVVNNIIKTASGDQSMQDVIKDMATEHPNSDWARIWQKIQAIGL